MNIRHNSWDLYFRDPFGALETGSEVTIRVTASDISNLRLRTYFNDEEHFYSMTEDSDPGLFSVTLELPDIPGIFWYDFRFEHNGHTYCYGTQSDTLGGEGQIYEAYPPSYQITLFEPVRKIPSWYTEGIMYQIFPDRFRHGDDPDFTPVYFKNSMLHACPEDTPHYFRNKDGSIEYWDFFGGNLAGIIEKLDYLAELNVSILYLNPIFESTSNHKYDTADYLKISPEFGNTALFKQLCTEAKKRGIRVILDGVFSHTGDDSRYFNKYGRYDTPGAAHDKESPWYSWYRFTTWPDEYESWWGVKSMPNVDEMNPDYQKFIFKDNDSVIRHWTRLGASGWRLDVADELPDAFIKGLKKSLIEEKKDAILIGEVWEDASRKIAYGKLREYFNGDELDAVMNYPFRTAMLDFITEKISSRSVSRQMMALYEHYPRSAFKGNMNLIGSHDRMRALTILGDAPALVHESEKENYRLTEKNYFLAKQRLKLLSLIQMTFPGVPCIYYGDEAGMQGYEDPYNRGPYPWGHEDSDLIDWYKKITLLRKNSPVLKSGSWYPLPSEDALFVYVRVLKNKTILCLFNRSQTSTLSYKNPLLKDRTGTELLTGKHSFLIHIKVEPLSGKIILLNDGRLNLHDIIDAYRNRSE